MTAQLSSLKNQLTVTRARLNLLKQRKELRQLFVLRQSPPKNR